MREGGERADRTCSAATVEEMKGWILEKGAGGPQGKGRSPEGERRVVTLDGTTEDSDDVLNVLGVFEVLELLELLDFSSDIHSRPCILSPPVQVDALGCHSLITLEGRGVRRGKSKGSCSYLIKRSCGSGIPSASSPRRSPSTAIHVHPVPRVLAYTSPAKRRVQHPRARRAARSTSDRDGRSGLVGRVGQRLLEGGHGDGWQDARAGSGKGPKGRGGR